MYRFSFCVLALARAAIAFNTTVFTTTETERGVARTFSAEVLPAGSTTYTLSASVTTRPEQTTTVVRTAYVLPTWFNSPNLLGKNVIEALLDFGGELTAAPPAASLSKFSDDIVSAYESYTSASPQPTIIKDLPETILDIADRAGARTADVLVGLNAQYDGGAPNSYTDYVKSFLSPYPALQTSYEEYLTTVASYNAPELFAFFTIAQRDLGVTSTPSFLTAVSSYLPSSTASGSGTMSTSSSGAGSSGTTGATGTTGTTTSSTSSSSGAAVPTARAEVMINAGIVAAGMAVLAMM